MSFSDSPSFSRSFPPQSFDEQVHAHVSFFDLFDHPLTLDELGGFLLREMAREELEHFLRDDMRFDEREGFWFLAGRQGLVNFRKVRGAIADAYWKKVRRYLPLSRMVPFVRMAAVCNTLAFNSPTAQSDIDLFFVVRRGRIFTARTLLTLLYALLGVRRHGDKVAGRLCLSFFVTDDAMDLSGIGLGESDPYLWFWMRTLIPVYGADCYREFAEANGFQAVADVGFGSARGLASANFGGGWRLVGRLWEFILGGWLGNKLENWLRKKQLHRHEQRRPTLGENSSVVVSDQMLKYHNIDRRTELNKRFFERYRDLS